MKLDHFWKVFKTNGMIDEVDAEDVMTVTDGSLHFFTDGNIDVIYAAGIWREVRRVIIHEVEDAQVSS